MEWPQSNHGITVAGKDNVGMATVRRMDRCAAKTYVDPGANEACVADGSDERVFIRKGNF